MEGQSQRQRILQTSRIPEEDVFVLQEEQVLCKCILSAVFTTFVGELKLKAGWLRKRGV